MLDFFVAINIPKYIVLHFHTKWILRDKIAMLGLAVVHRISYPFSDS